MRISMEVKPGGLIRALRLMGHSVAARVARGRTAVKPAGERKGRRGVEEKLNERSRS